MTRYMPVIANVCEVIQSILHWITAQLSVARDDEDYYLNLHQVFND